MYLRLIYWFFFGFQKFVKIKSHHQIIKKIWKDQIWSWRKLGFWKKLFFRMKKTFVWHFDEIWAQKDFVPRRSSGGSSVWKIVFLQNTKIFIFGLFFIFFSNKQIVDSNLKNLIFRISISLFKLKIIVKMWPHRHGPLFAIILWIKRDIKILKMRLF